MNTRQLVAAAALALLGTSAFAGGEFDPLTGFGAQVSPAPVVVAKAAKATVATSETGVTREQVKAEFLKARAEGTIVNYDVGSEYARVPAGVSRDRQDVTAEVRSAKAGS
jgi:hypothetical protein